VQNGSDAAARFGKPADMIVYTEAPFNAEQQRGTVADEPLTPANPFYVRGHGEVPELSPGTSVSRVTGLVMEPLALSVSSARVPPRRVVGGRLQDAKHRAHAATG
jgi:DMSO/TMAO reductase YedYZ molybdopterin-dependent catalytic subunit